MADIDNWEVSLAKMRKQAAGLEGDAQLEMERKVEALENAIRMRDSLSKETTPESIEFKP